MAKANTIVGDGALERGHRASLEALAQLFDTLTGVGAAAMIIDAAKSIIAQAARAAT